MTSEKRPSRRVSSPQPGAGGEQGGAEDADVAGVLAEADAIVAEAAAVETVADLEPVAGKKAGDDGVPAAPPGKASP